MAVFSLCRIDRRQRLQGGCGEGEALESGSKRAEHDRIVRFRACPESEDPCALPQSHRQTSIDSDLSQLRVVSAGNPEADGSSVAEEEGSGPALGARDRGRLGSIERAQVKLLRAPA